ncbi:helix-turn-helix domain-containing protein [Dryocola sp. LX212]|jgi:CRP-like cAMP-binding protein
MILQFSEAEELFAKNDFEALKQQLLSVGRKLQYSKGMTIQSGKNEVLVIISGRMLVSTSKKNSLIIGDTVPFFPVGLMEEYYKIPLFYYIENEATVVQLTVEDFNKLFFYNPEYAQLLTRIMSIISVRLIHAYYERVNDSGYATIREMLHRYLFKIEEGTVINVGVASFILKRTRLSRSYVFQVLSALKRGGYITICNGKLVSINREIPERY